MVIRIVVPFANEKLEFRKHVEETFRKKKSETDDALPPLDGWREPRMKTNSSMKRDWQSSWQGLLDGKHRFLIVFKQTSVDWPTTSLPFEKGRSFSRGAGSSPPWKRGLNVSRARGGEVANADEGRQMSPTFRRPFCTKLFNRGRGENEATSTPFARGSLVAGLSPPFPREPRLIS